MRELACPRECDGRKGAGGCDETLPGQASAAPSWCTADGKPFGQTIRGNMARITVLRRCHRGPLMPAVKDLRTALKGRSFYGMSGPDQAPVPSAMEL